MYRGARIRITPDFSAEVIQVKKKQNKIIKVFQEKNQNIKFFIQQTILQKWKKKIDFTTRQIKITRICYQSNLGL